MVPETCNDDARPPTRREYVEAGRSERKGRPFDLTESVAQTPRNFIFHFADVAERAVELRRRGPSRSQLFVLKAG